MANLKTNTTTIQSILEAVNNLPEAGGTTPTGEIDITSNGTHNVTEYASANVNVPIPDGYVKPTGTLTITTNGTHTVTNYDKATVNIPTEIPDGYANVSGVTATAADVLASKKIVLSNGTLATGTIATKTSSNLSVSGATVTVPAGYYASQATKSVSTATQATPSISVSSSGLITASATQSAGYVSSGTKSSTKQLTTKSADTITPGTTEKTAVNSGVYTTGAIKVAGDSNLVSSNIKSGVSIFGVAGSYEGSSGGSTSFGEKILGHSVSNPTFTLDTTNLKGFFAYATTPTSESAYKKYIVSIFYICDYYDDGYPRTYMLYQSQYDEYYHGAVYGGDTDIASWVTIASNAVTIVPISGYYFYEAPYLVPIYG